MPTTRSQTQRVQEKKPADEKKEELLSAEKVKKLKHSLEELEKRNERLEQTNERLEQTNEGLERMVKVFKERFQGLERVLDECDMYELKGGIEQLYREWYC